MNDITAHVANLPDELSQCLGHYQGKISHYLFEMACLDGLQELRIKRALPRYLLKYFRKVMDLYDESTQSLLGELRRSGYIVQCQPDCCHCCYHMPAGLSTIELIFIYHGMTRSGAMNRMYRHCLEAEESWVEIFKQCLELSVSEEGPDFSEEDALHSYHRMGQPCPFLENSRCQIYAYRPFACRMHFSLSPPHWCRPTHFQNPHAVRFNLEPGEVVFDAMERLNNRFQLDLSDVMVSGLLQMMVNVMQFEEIHWLH